MFLPATRSHCGTGTLAYRSRAGLPLPVMLMSARRIPRAVVVPPAAKRARFLADRSD
jgi:hypothetical protein